MKNTDTSPHLSRTSSMTTSEEETDQDEDEEDQESEFSLGRLIRQASMNSSHTSNPSRKTSKVHSFAKNISNIKINLYV